MDDKDLSPNSMRPFRIYFQKWDDFGSQNLMG